MNKQIRRKRLFAPNFKNIDNAITESPKFWFFSYYCLRNSMTQNVYISISKFLDLCEK